MHSSASQSLNVSYRKIFEIQIKIKKTIDVRCGLQDFVTSRFMGNRPGRVGAFNARGLTRIRWSPWA